jgi:hypothetical protein
MSTDFFLQSKYIYKQIEIHLKEVVELYKEFIELVESQEQDTPTSIKYNKEDDINFLMKTRDEYHEKLKQISFFKDFVNRKIVCNCNHNFIKDSIDISSELSQEIEYCEICEYTKFS